MGVCGSHSIYYRVQSGYVEIMRVILSTLLLAALIHRRVAIILLYYSDFHEAHRCYEQVA